MPKSWGNRYWLTPATKIALDGNPALAEQIAVAVHRITDLHLAHPNLPQQFHTETLPNGDRVRVVSQWGREYVYLERIPSEAEISQCTLFLEVGRLDLVDVALLGEHVQDPAILEFSSSITAEYMGSIDVDEKGRVRYRIQGTPVSVTCEGEEVVLERWGLDAGGELTEGESINVAIPVCLR